MKKLVQQKNNINVVGVKRGSIECPSGTWQRRKGSGNPKDSPVCSNLDSEVCGPGAKSKWANLTQLDNGSVVSLDGMVECVSNGVNGETDPGISDQFEVFWDKCFIKTSTDCPIDLSNVNGDKRDQKMKKCSELTHSKYLSPEKRTDDQKACVGFAKQSPKDLGAAVEFFCLAPDSPILGGNDCMCFNPQGTFTLEKYKWPKDTEFWDNLTKKNPVLYKQRGTWLKACNSTSYLNSPFLTSTSPDIDKTCNNLDVFLGGQKEAGNLNDVTLSDFKDLSICYTDGKLTGGGGNTFFDKYFWYIIAFIVVTLVVLMIVAYVEKKKKTKNKKTTKTSKTNEKISSAKK